MVVMKNERTQHDDDDDVIKLHCVPENNAVVN